ncbi:hypothetical protein RchiOBHm_Chr2g0107931 [Rosa chinensis]|uniref:Uncharacterized protein n=1 Tax=Rosa chinensis TaxID=74649 RepID=A0A2P6RP30_ROSCH|nr:hypothetical protein RchiOBHm_Chr2g0107931 [Rosa chinensis]
MIWGSSAFLSLSRPKRETQEQRKLSNLFLPPPTINWRQTTFNGFVSALRSYLRQSWVTEQPEAAAKRSGLSSFDLDSKHGSSSYRPPNRLKLHPQIRINLLKLPEPTLHGGAARSSSCKSTPRNRSFRSRYLEM